MGKIYCILDVDAKQVKIGYSENSGESRLAHFRTGNPSKLVLLAEIDGTMAEERMLHKLLSKYKSPIRQEWFDAQCIGYLLENIHSVSLVIPDITTMHETETLLEASRKKLQRVSNVSRKLMIVCAILSVVISRLLVFGISDSAYILHATIFFGMMAFVFLFGMHYSTNHFYRKDSAYKALTE